MKIYETLKVGDVFYENVYGKSIKYVVTLATKIKTIDVLSKERRQFEWTGITESGEYQGFLVTEGLEHYGPKIHGKDELI